MVSSKNTAILDLRLYTHETETSVAKLLQSETEPNGFMKLQFHWEAASLEWETDVSGNVTRQLE
jgi:hypothetical protein